MDQGTTPATAQAVEARPVAAPPRPPSLRTHLAGSTACPTCGQAPVDVARRIRIGNWLGLAPLAIAGGLWLLGIPL